MKNSRNTTISMLILGTSLILMSSGNVYAYSCGKTFKEAQSLISQAESLVTDETDSRIIAMIEEAKGLAQSGIVSHSRANERHTGDTGKYAHADSVRKGRWAKNLANEALFLLTGTPR